MLSIDIVGLTGACSYALDCIEAELVNIKNKHGKRVAYISIRMAEYWKIQGDELQDLAMCALLHDKVQLDVYKRQLQYKSKCKGDNKMNKRDFNVVGNEGTDNQELAKGIAFVKSRRAEPVSYTHLIQMFAK